MTSPLHAAPGASGTAAGSEVTAIIVSYRTAALTLKAVEALHASFRETGLPDRVMVIDNASGDAATLGPALRDGGYGDWVRLVEAPRNGGYGYGNNLAAKLALEQGPVRYFWLVNPDTMVDPMAATWLKRSLDADPGRGIAGSSFTNQDGSLWPIAFRFPTVLSEFTHAVSWGPMSRLLQRHVVARSMAQDAEAPVDWVAGASMMIRASLMQRLGGFDERFFLYYEETDLCFRAKASGAAVVYQPSSHVMHIAGASTKLTERGRAPPRMPPYWFASRGRYYRLRYGLVGWLLVDMMTLIGLVVGGAKRRLLGRPRTAPEHFFWDLIRHSGLRPRGEGLPPMISSLQER